MAGSGRRKYARQPGICPLRVVETLEISNTILLTARIYTDDGLTPDSSCRGACVLRGEIRSPQGEYQTQQGIVCCGYKWLEVWPGGFLLLVTARFVVRMGSIDCDTRNELWTMLSCDENLLCQLLHMDTLPAISSRKLAGCSTALYAYVFTRDFPIG
jgi:hypothetical protein